LNIINSKILGKNEIDSADVETLLSGKNGLFIKGEDITIPLLLNIIHSSGYLDGENIDKEEFGILSPNVYIVEFSFLDIAQFQILFEITSASTYYIIKRPAESIMLQEDDFNILLETGDNLLIQGLVP